MAIKITGDNLQYGDTAIATLTNTNFNLASGKVFSTDVITASMMSVTDGATFAGQLTASNGIKSNGRSWLNEATWIGSPFMTPEAANQYELIVYASINSDLIPADAARDLGSTNRQWTEAHIDTVLATTLKAADGTSAGSIADSTGVVTLASSVLTTADINGGTADNVVIGGSTAAAGTFTTLSAVGNVYLGDATSDTITATGRFLSDLVPSTDSARDLGSPSLQWAEAHVDHGYIDDITATGTSTLTTVDINGGAIDGTTIGASSAAAGTFTAIIGTSAVINGNTAITGTFDVNGNTSLDGTLHTNGAINTEGTLNVDGASTLRAVAITGTLNVTDVAIFNGRTYFENETTMEHKLTASNGIAVDGDATFAQRTTFSGVTTVNAHLTASAGLRSNGSSWFGEEVEVAGDLQVNANVTLGDASSDVTTITGQLTASNGARILGDVVLASGDSIKAGTYITYSDATLKENIEVISNPIDKVMSMRGVTYNFKTNSENSEVGFLAQEMKQAVPEVVYGNGDGNLGIDYAKLTSVLVEAIKTQQTQIEQQQSQIDELKESLLKNK